MRIHLVVVIAFAASGCAQWKASARISPQSVAEYASPIGAKGGHVWPDYTCNLTHGPYDSQTGAVNLDCFKFPEDRSSAGTLTAYALAAGIPRPDGAWKIHAKLSRDRLAGLLIKHADDVCVVEKGRLLATQTTADVGLSFLTTALSTASTIVGGEQAKSILSGLATVSNGTQDNVNATFYQNQLSQAITKAMDGERKALLTAITAKRASSVDDYSVDEMIRGVNEYHQACSFEKGLQLLLEAAVDSSGANAAQQFRATLATTVRLRSRIEDLRKTIGANTKAGISNDDAIAQLKEAEAALHGLVMAGAATAPKGDSPVEAETPAADEGQPAKD